MKNSQEGINFRSDEGEGRKQVKTERKRRECGQKRKKKGEGKAKILQDGVIWRLVYEDDEEGWREERERRERERGTENRNVNGSRKEGRKE